MNRFFSSSGNLEINFQLLSFITRLDKCEKFQMVSLLNFPTYFQPEGFEFKCVHFHDRAFTHEAALGTNIIQGAQQVLEIQVSFFHNQMVLFALRECFISSRVRLENDQIHPNLPD